MLQSCERKAGSPVCLSWSDAHFRLQPAHNRKTDTNLRQVSALRAGKTHLFALCNSLGQRRTNTPVFILKTTPTSLRRSGEQRGGFDCCPKRATASQARGVGRTRLRPTPSYAPPPDKIHRYSLVARFTRRPVQPARPQVRHHIHV